MIPLQDDHAIIITGGAGFIGSNLAASFARDGHRVVIIDNLSRAGVERNWDWLRSEFGDRITLLRDDIRNAALAEQLMPRASAVFHLAAQVAVTDSLEDPIQDFDVNVYGTLLWLEAIRRTSRAIPFIFASTNKVYGNLSDVLLEKEEMGWVPCDRTLRHDGLSEKRPLDFHTPYGCSKGAADQYVLDYSRSFGVPTLGMRMRRCCIKTKWSGSGQCCHASSHNAISLRTFRLIERFFAQRTFDAHCLMSAHPIRLAFPVIFPTSNGTFWPKQSSMPCHECDDLIGWLSACRSGS